MSTIYSSSCNGSLTAIFLKFAERRSMGSVDGSMRRSTGHDRPGNPRALLFGRSMGLMMTIDRVIPCDRPGACFVQFLTSFLHLCTFSPLLIILALQNSNKWKTKKPRQVCINSYQQICISTQKKLDFHHQNNFSKIIVPTISPFLMMINQYAKIFFNFKKWKHISI